MNFWESLAVLRRRWYVVVPGLLLTLVLCAGAYKQIPTTYQADAIVVLVASADPAANSKSAAPGNPFLNIESTNYTLLADVFSKRLMAPATADQLSAAGMTATYTVTTQPDIGPILAISSQNKDGAMAVRTTQGLVARLSTDLQQVQKDAGAPAVTWVQSRVVSLPDAPSKQQKSKTRAIIAIMAIGVLLSVFGAFLVERLASRRRRQDQSRAIWTEPQRHGVAPRFAEQPRAGERETHPERHELSGVVGVSGADVRAGE